MDIDGRNICILLSTALITGRLITFSMWVGQVKLAYFNFCFLSIVLKNRMYKSFESFAIVNIMKTA